MKAFLAAAAVVILGALAWAQNKDTPPMEPPYTQENEFDPVLSEDPAASSNSPIPVTPGIEPGPFPEAVPEPVKPVARPKGKEPTYGTSDLVGTGAPAGKGVKKIRHPDAKKGLVRIESDGSYIYRVKTTPKDKSGILRFGYMDPPDIVSKDGATDFQDMYGSGSVFALMFDYEWQPFSKYGKLGVQAGVGLALTNGNGRFLVPDASGSYEAQEKYDFVVVPLNLGVIYRLEYFKRQWIAPYLSGGGTYIAVAEMRDDGKNNFSGTPAAYGAGGLMFNITALDRQLAFNLDSEYGVGNLWLVAEYRFQQAFSEDLNFTGGIMSLGISADF